MTTTMSLIAKQTVGANGASSVSFSNIPQTYTDLKVVYSARCSDTTNNWNVLIGYFNTDSTSGNYPSRTLYGFSTATGSADVNKWFGYLPNPSSWFSGTFGNGEFYVPNYSVSGISKSVNIDSVTEGNSASLIPRQLTATRWTGTDPINAMTFSCDTGSFLENSTFYLYGISNSTTTQNETVPYASGGDVITTDGTYWYHTFLYSGTFTPLKELTCDYLVVAGGGASGYRSDNADYYCGGGGGGGLLTSVGTSGGGASAGAALALTTQPYTVTIGAGGTKVSNANGTAGANSVFASITATGGGYGGNNGTRALGGGGSGGSGGGATGGDNGGDAGTAVSPTQGYNGGSVSLTGTGTGGAGGGGAGSVGASVTTTVANGGNGGAPLANSISGSSVYYAGGGAGGRGYGMSNGSNNANYVYAANRGSGGYPSGGANENGCSGIVVVRYAV